LVFESEWTVLFFARWCSDVRQRKLMWRLPARLRENVTTMGVDQLFLDSDFPLPVVQQWLTAHDTYDWTSQRRRYRMAGPSRDNPNGVNQDLVEFAHIFDPMGETLEAVGQPKPCSNQPESPRTPDVTTETEQDPLLKTPPGAQNLCRQTRKFSRQDPFHSSRRRPISRRPFKFLPFVSFRMRLRQ
jgi:hypothetical protein